MFIVFDNGGKTLDRYTIINKETGDIFGSCENPDGPNGVEGRKAIQRRL